MELNEQNLIRAISKYERILRAFIRGSGVYRPDDIDEVMQEVLVKVWSKLEQLRNIDDFPKWAIVIAKYEVLNFRKKKARDRLVLNDKVTELLMDEGEDETSNSDLLKKLEHCLSFLNKNQQDLIKTAYQPGILMDELTKSFGIKANAIYQKLWRIRQKLALCVKSTTPESNLKGSILP